MPGSDKCELYDQQHSRRYWAPEESEDRRDTSFDSLGDSSANMAVDNNLPPRDSINPRKSLIRRGLDYLVRVYRKK